MKRLICLMLSLIMVFALFAGCDGTNTPVDPSSSDTTSSDSSDGDKTDDSSSQGEDSVPENKISVPVTADKTFEALPAEYSTLLNSNPDRGFRSEEIYVVPEISELRNNKGEYTYEKLLQKVRSQVNANLGETVMVSRTYFRMTNYKDTPNIPTEAYNYIDNICKAYKEVGVKMYWEAYYQQSSQPEMGARKSVILKHLDTYGEIWKKHKDTIFAVCFGLIGGYGEWTTVGNNLYDDDFDYENATYDEKIAAQDAGKREITAKLLSLLPDGTYLTMRRPNLKAENVPKDHPKYNMIGFAQDAFFGKMFPSEDYGQGVWLPDNSGGWWEMAIKESAIVPNDGELFTTRYFKDNAIYVEPYSSIQVFSELHHTIFSINHGYSDMLTFQTPLTETVFYGWKGEEVTPEKLDELGVFYSPNWFKNQLGETVQRNVFEYVRDYLGYRISAKTLNISGGTKAGEKINLKMSLQNYGFSAVFNMESGFAILDEENNVVSEVYAGDPTSWHSRNPKNYNDFKLLTHNVSASLKLPEKSGVYKVAFFVRNKLGQTVRLDNTTEYANGFNILHMFTVD